MSPSSTVGLIANPASARDIRRLVADGGAVTTHDKLNRLRRVMTGLAASGIDRVLSMADGDGIASGLERFASRASAKNWPTIVFVDQPITQSAVDTMAATEKMVEAGVGCIVVLGGDGTNRIVAMSSGSVPLVSLSTGTNNAFPRPLEPTVAGMAAGLIARNDDIRDAGTYQAKWLHVECGDRSDYGLVDVAVASTDGVGSGAIWDAGSVSEIYLTFAEADAIGLSAVGGHIRPTSRRGQSGLAIQVGEPATSIVTAPIAPGLVTAVPIMATSKMEPNTPVLTRNSSGVIAIDGERMFRFTPTTRPTITLRTDGPIVVDVAEALDYAARHQLLAAQTNPDTRSQSLTHQPSDATPGGSNYDRTQSTRAVHRDGADSTVRIAHLAGVPR